MTELYRRPLRVYLLLGALAVWGVVSGLGLSISLFPMSTQPTVSVSVGYGSYSSQQFFESVGRGLEPRLQSAKADGVPVEELTATYGDQDASFRLKFGWGADPDEAVKTVQTAVTSYLARFEDGIRNSANVYTWRSDGGSFFVSFYSPLRSLDELHKILEPLITPLSSKVPDVANLGLYNPNQKEITVRLNPEKLALFELTTRQVEAAIKDSVFALSGGTLNLGEKEYQIDLPKKAASVEQLANIRVSPQGKDPVMLKNVAEIEVALSKESQQSFRTRGVESLILFASPKEGGNVKRMADDISTALKALEKKWPADVEYKILVNPSEFISRSISGVLKEVALAAFLAVLVLFFFIGSFRNVITAAIEIPLSLLMAFILMQLTGMNLNLISLGGLALSAGMNVDASVVVLENIFRHFEGKGKGLTYEEKVRTVAAAVAEVRVPILAATVSSLVVFLPLVFTRGLTNSLLGDLAKAVIFSHGLSAFVALLLVPTIRLHLLRKGEMGHSASPFEGFLSGIERFYERSLQAFLRNGKAQAAAFSLVLLVLPALYFLVLPGLKKEVIGKPESEWLIVGVNSPVINSVKEMESEVSLLEQDLYTKFGDDIQYTFSQVYQSTNGNVMLRLKDRKKVQELIAKAEDVYKNTPTKFYYVVSWSPSELRIPEPPQYRLEITGGSPVRRQQVAYDLRQTLSEPGLFDNVSTRPSAVAQKGLMVSPLPNLTEQPEVLSRFDLSHFLRIATNGMLVDRIYDRNMEYPVYLRMPEERGKSLEALAALPVGFEGRLIPAGALASFRIAEKEPAIYRKDMQAMTVIDASLKKNNLSLEGERVARAREAVEAYRRKMEESGQDNPLLIEAQADRELRDALSQLQWAVLISIALIFLTMVLQLGDVVHSLLVLVAIPLGFIGVIVSLAVFGSTLSLNSGLGTILLNGIAVANSIILVDFIRRKFAEGLGPLEATVSASATRLRPILMTSLTTVLGMFPIALGLGEGGKTLQPLGIAVCGGLWVSTLLTLYFVPCLQYRYLRWKTAPVRHEREAEVEGAVRL